MPKFTIEYIPTLKTDYKVLYVLIIL